MLPAYFATSFRHRRALIAMTAVFALGVGAVILPITFGASGISRLIQSHHFEVFLAGGLFMVALGVATVAGWKLPLPMPGMEARRQRGPGAVFALGAFSGVASACCAPVLAGVVALSGTSGSFLSALGVGVAYVFGMVAPLIVLATVWDRRDWGNSALLRGRQFNVGFGGRRRQIHSTTLASGVLLIGIGALVTVLAFTGPAMPSRGWQVTLSARLQHYAHNVTSALSWVPGWVMALALVGVLILLGRKVIDQLSAEPAPPPAEDDEGDHDDMPVAIR